MALPNPEKQATAEESFLSSLHDVHTILKALVGYCGTPQEALEMCELALGNSGQLRLLMDTVTRNGK